MNTQELKAFDESYQWWGDFLEARREAIHAIHRLGKSFEDIQATLSLTYPEHAKAIWNGTSSNHEEE